MVADVKREDICRAAWRACCGGLYKPHWLAEEVMEKFSKTLEYKEIASNIPFDRMVSYTALQLSKTYHKQYGSNPKKLKKAPKLSYNDEAFAKLLRLFYLSAYGQDPWSMELKEEGLNSRDRRSNADDKGHKSSCTDRSAGAQKVLRAIEPGERLVQDAWPVFELPVDVEADAPAVASKSLEPDPEQEQLSFWGRLKKFFRPAPPPPSDAQKEKEADDRKARLNAAFTKSIVECFRKTGLLYSSIPYGSMIRAARIRLTKELSQNRSAGGYREADCLGAMILGQDGLDLMYHMSSLRSDPVPHGALSAGTVLIYDTYELVVDRSRLPEAGQQRFDLAFMHGKLALILENNGSGTMRRIQFLSPVIPKLKSLSKDRSQPIMAQHFTGYQLTNGATRSVQALLISDEKRSAQTSLFFQGHTPIASYPTESERCLGLRNSVGNFDGTAGSSVMTSSILLEWDEAGTKACQDIVADRISNQHDGVLRTLCTDTEVRIWLRSCAWYSGHTHAGQAAYDHVGAAGGKVQPEVEDMLYVKQVLNYGRTDCSVFSSMAAPPPSDGFSVFEEKILNNLLDYLGGLSQIKEATN